MENRKNIYFITLQNNLEYAFEDFSLMNKFTSTLKNRAYYFRKISALKTNDDNKNLYVVSTDEGEFAFDDTKMMKKFISPFDSSNYYCRKVTVIRTEEELQNLTNQTQNQPQ